MLEKLCSIYWLPLYAYVRRRVREEHEAQDLTQAFFERLLEKNYLAGVDPERGCFRAFLLTAFKHSCPRSVIRRTRRSEGEAGGHGNCSCTRSDPPRAVTAQKRAVRRAQCAPGVHVLNSFWHHAG